MKRDQNEKEDKQSKEAEFLKSFGGFDSGKYAYELFKEIRANGNLEKKNLKCSIGENYLI